MLLWPITNLKQLTSRLLNLNQNWCLQLCTCISLRCVHTTQRQHYALLSVSWQKWITTQQLIWCLSQCSTYIFIHSVWHSMDESIARVWPVTDMKGTFQFNTLMYILTFMFIILSIHHIRVMNRHPAGPWYGKLDILWFMKRGGLFFYLPLLFMSPDSCCKCL